MHPNDISSQKNAFRPRRVDAPPKGMVNKKNEKNVKRIIFGTGKSWVVGGEKMKVREVNAEGDGSCDRSSHNFFDKRRDEGCAGQGCGRSGRGIG